MGAKRRTPRGFALGAAAGILLIAAAPHPAQARPYYAAKKALSCAACHTNPAGGGPRWPTERAPVRINDQINIGADLRVMGSKSQGNHAANPSSFSTPDIGLYVMARPDGDLQGLQLVYDNNLGNTVEAYGMWSKEIYSLPVYIRAGRFWVPYGLQIDDIDQVTASYIKGLLFSPSVGFSMTNTASDTGVEIGLNPKKGYFVNLSATNGQPNGAQARNNAKAVTARAGFITKWLALGITGFRNHPLGVGNALEERAGFFGWTRLWKFALLGEWGIGRNKTNASPGVPQVNTYRRAGTVELDVELLAERLLLKGRYDFVNPNTVSSANVRRRYTAGLEWFATKNSSVEAQYRILTESPEIKNNQGLIAAHVWF